jgi:hypothetical protein
MEQIGNMVKQLIKIKLVKNMDVGFEILVPIESNMSAIKFEQPIFEWQGEKYPQGPKETWLYYFKLIKSNVPQHILSFLPDSFKKDQWQCISIIEGIDKLERDLVSTENVKKESETKLLDLLNLLIGNELKWIVVFEPDYDRIDEVIEGNVDTAFQKISKSLKEEKSGFVIWFDKLG